jgi:hypothetical protein
LHNLYGEYMKNYLLRRRKLGKKSTEGISDACNNGLGIVRNWKSADINYIEPGDGYVFRWGCTSNLPAGSSGKTVVNTSESIHWCANKKESRLLLQQAGVRVPLTWTCERFKQSAHLRLDTDTIFVLRSARHSQGKYLWAGTANEIIDTYMDYIDDGYVSVLIDKVAEYRVFVCQGKAVWVAKKTPADAGAIAWNVAQGGRFDNVRWGEWPLQVVTEALKAAAVSGTDFSGVDVMVDAEGNPYVLEVNSAPSQTSPYRQQCVAKAFDYIITNGKQGWDVPDVVVSWRDVIHPAVLGRSNE